MTITATDGTDVRVHDEGSGPAIVPPHPGLDDGTRDHEPAAGGTGRAMALFLRA